MVDEAKGERFTAEKRLADATGQVKQSWSIFILSSLLLRLKPWKLKYQHYIIYSKLRPNHPRHKSTGDHLLRKWSKSYHVSVGTLVALNTSTHTHLYLNTNPLKEIS